MQAGQKQMVLSRYSLTFRDRPGEFDILLIISKIVKWNRIFRLQFSLLYLHKSALPKIAGTLHASVRVCVCVLMLIFI